MKLKIGESAFEEMIIEANQPRWGRDGKAFPPQFTTRTPLRHGTADPLAPEYSSHAAWRFDPQKSMVEARIPWGLIYFMSPANHLVYGGTGPSGEPLPVRTSGIAAVAAMLDREGGVARETLPDAEHGKVTSPPLYGWEGWRQVQHRSYKKASYAALKEIFAEMNAR